MAEIPVEIGTRGHLRLNVRTCSFVPLLIDFPKKDELLKGTPFQGQSSLKLTTHCQGDKQYEQYVMREYIAYRIFNLLTPRSYRARLAGATYQDPSGKVLETRTAMFIEDDDDVARRQDARAVNLPRLQFKDLEQDSLTLLMLFQYMIGNTDYSIWARHNVKVEQDQTKTLYPVTFDFDLSGLVRPPYAIPDSRLGISSVRDRLYRGPCRTQEDYEPFLAKFRAKKDDILALFDAVPDLDQRYRKEARAYMEDFYATMNKPVSVKRQLVDGCRKNPTM
jgi:hypothetical protein